MLQLSDLKIAVIGLGYVGLPLAVEFGKKVPVVGFDIHQKRIGELKNGQDHTLEVSPEELAQSMHLQYSAHLDDLKDCNFFIVTVPTPIDEYKQPDLSPLVKASESIAKVLKKTISWCTNLRYIQGQLKRFVFLYWKKIWLEI